MGPAMLWRSMLSFVGISLQTLISYRECYSINKTLIKKGVLETWRPISLKSFLRIKIKKLISITVSFSLHLMNLNSSTFWSLAYCFIDLWERYSHFMIKQPVSKSKLSLSFNKSKMLGVQILPRKSALFQNKLPALNLLTLSLKVKLKVRFLFNFKLDRAVVVKNLWKMDEWIP